MFERFRNRGENKNNAPQQPVTPEQLPVTAHAIDRSLGNVGLRQVEIESPVEYDQQAKEILSESEATLLEFAHAAAAEGLNQDEIAQAILAGVEAKRLPAIAHPEYRAKDMSVTYHVVHGDSIPDGAVNVNFSRSSDESDPTIKGVSLVVSHEQRSKVMIEEFMEEEGVPMPEEGSFYVETIPVSAGNSGLETPDFLKQEFLQKLRTAARVE